MRLFIAEKPSVAKAIAAELGQTGSGDGFIKCGDDIVTWCFGHMLEQAEPDEYTSDDVPRTKSGGKVWRTDELPIVPEQWKLIPKPDAAKQLKGIGSLLKDAAEVVNAGDPDREGQLLVDEVLEHFHNHKPVKRFLVSAQDSVSVKRGLAALEDNAKYRGWADAATARRRADWLIGMNLTRAFTLRAQRGGSRSLLTVGRVQTPTLALVVTRDREIEGFKPVPYFTLTAKLQHDAGTFSARWEAKEEQPGLDSERRLVDAAVADALSSSLKGQGGTVSEYKQEPKKTPHPLAFALSDITLAASNKFGHSAADVLAACQALYEAKLTSYPRTDCPYLPESQHSDARAVLDAIKHVNPDLSATVDAADPSIKSRTWDDKKITAHHGIIPTMHKGSAANLSKKERDIYGLIVKAYLANFYPVHEYLATSIKATVGGESFLASGRVVTRNGWKDVYEETEDSDAKEKDETADQKLPGMKQGDAVTCIEVDRAAKKTKPPQRYNEGTLGRAMEQIHKHVTDPKHKQMLKETDGIGTPATRATIITDLKAREFLTEQGKYIVSTTLGRSLIDALPEVAKNPALTALYERALKDIEAGKASLEAFVSGQIEFVRNQVAKANDGAVKIAGGKTAAHVSEVHKCMACNSGLSRRPGKKPGTHWWGCSNYPTCEQTYPDAAGKPDYSKGRSASAAKT